MIAVMVMALWETLTEEVSEPIWILKQPLSLLFQPLSP